MLFKIPSNLAFVAGALRIKLFSTKLSPDLRNSVYGTFASPLVIKILGRPVSRLSSLVIPISSKSLIMSEYKLGFSVTKIGTLPLIKANRIMAATTRPLPTPVWSPMMKPLPASALRIDRVSASICSAEKSSRSVSGSISKAFATYSSTLPTSDSIRAIDS